MRDRQVKTTGQWIEAGLPRTGATKCGSHCRYYLQPVEWLGDEWALQADELFIRLWESLGKGEKMETEKTETTEERALEGENLDLEDGQHRAVMSLGSLEGTSGAGFEIMAITAGKGNGWIFGAEVLQASVPLWDKTQCFIDHQLTARSVKDLAGVLSGPAWSEEKQGIRAQLRAVGPSGAVLQELGKVVLSGEIPAPAVGFSADIIFTANGKVVEKVLKGSLR